jgi:hypothetical protein
LDTNELTKLKEDYLKNNKIRYIGKRPKKDTFETNDILTVYTHGWTYKVL